MNYTVTVTYQPNKPISEGLRFAFQCEYQAESFMNRLMDALEQDGEEVDLMGPSTAFVGDYGFLSIATNDGSKGTTPQEAYLMAADLVAMGVAA
jgi:hypothetical protein